jgi:hypothetical protein
MIIIERLRLLLLLVIMESGPKIPMSVSEYSSSFACSSSSSELVKVIMRSLSDSQTACG